MSPPGSGRDAPVASGVGSSVASAEPGPCLWVHNGAAARLDDVPRLAPAEFRAAVVAAGTAGGRLAALGELDPRAASATGRHDLLAVLALDARRVLGLVRTRVEPGEPWPALTADLPEAHPFERELWEDHGLAVTGHPWLRPLRRHEALEGGGPLAAPRAGGGAAPLRVEGDEVHEVAVGPVHAGIIEPGHFRFHCAGETVLHLDIHLGYQRRGATALLRDAPAARRRVVAESIAGDTAVGHGLAHAEALEALAGVEAPPAARALRALALELERLHNHAGDLGALCGDVGHLPGASWFGRLRGEFLNLLMELSGNRFGRGLLRFGGVRFGLDARRRADFRARLRRAARDLDEVAELVFDTPSVLSRFENAGDLPSEVARSLGLVGPAARASGLDRDVRRDHPSGAYRDAPFPVVREEAGDVMARARVRWLEARHSLRFLDERLDSLPDGPLAGGAAPEATGAPGTLAVALVEGWRGEVVHWAVASGGDRFTAYAVVDPSLHNWFGLAVAMRGRQVSDFPLCNKSFDLSYAGHDL